MAASTPVMSTTKSSAKQHTSEGLKEWDDDDIVRLFRLLKRSMADAESASVFPDDEFDMRKTESTSVAAETPSPTKGGKPVKKKVKTLSPSKNKVANVDFDPVKVAGLQHAFEKLGGGVSAAGICLSILATGELPKQVSGKALRNADQYLIPFATSSIPKTSSSLAWIRSRRRLSMSFCLLSKLFPTSKVRFQLYVASVIVPQAHFTCFFRSSHHFTCFGIYH